MAEPKSKQKKQFTRKKKVEYTRVTFAVPEIFGDDEEFDLPNLRQLPSGVQRQMRTSPDVFLNWIVDHVTAEEAEAIDTLDEEEHLEFLEAWSKASKVAAGKSSS